MELIEDIRRVENESEKIIASAQGQSDELIRQTREEMKQALEAVKEECRKHEAQLLAEHERGAQREADMLREENRKNLETLRASAGKNMEQAIQLIIDTIAGKS